MLLGRLIALISNAHPLSRTPPGLRQGFILACLGRTPPRKTSLHRDRPAPSLRLASSGRTHRHALTRCGILRRRRTGGSGAWGISLLHDVKQPAALAQRKRNSSRLDIPSPSHRPWQRAGLMVSSLISYGAYGRRSYGLRVPGLASQVWWSQTGSNRRPPACKAGALPTELWPRLDRQTGRDTARDAARDTGRDTGRDIGRDTARDPCPLRSASRRGSLWEDPTTEVVGLERFELSTSRLSSARSNQLSYRPGKRGGCPKRRKRNEGGGVPQIGALVSPMCSKRQEGAKPSGFRPRISQHP
jgi:hypothetical protein